MRRPVPHRLPVALALLLSVVVGVALAGDPPTPEGLAQQCYLQALQIAQQDVSGGMTSVVNEADARFDQLFDSMARPSEYYKVAAAAVAQLEKIDLQARRKIDRLIDRCIVRIQRLGADPGLVAELDSARDELNQNISSFLFESIESVHSDMEDGVFPA